MRGKHEEAIKALGTALDLDPQYADAWNNRGIVLTALGRNEEANASFARASELMA